MKLTTVTEFMELNNISEPTLYDWKEKGKILVTKILNKNYILDDPKCHVIAVGNIKGGAGKTTATVNLACYSAISGLKTLLIDCDHQNNCQYFFSEDVISKTKYDMFDVIYHNKSIEESKIETDVVGLDMVLSNEKLTLEAPNKEPSIVLLKEKIEKVKDKYNLIFIDTSPSFDIYNKNAFLAADAVLIPTKLHPLYIKGIEQLLDGLDQYINSGEVSILGIFKNILDYRFKKTEYYSKFIDDNYGNLAFETGIRTDATIEYLTLDRKNIFYTEKKNKAQEDYKKLFKEILERL